jgi:fumarate reductase flavoprotein subunit
MSGVLDAKGVAFEAEVPVLIIGAGAAGLCAALAANEAGVEVVVVERDKAPRGSTALSAGLIPAAGTRFQRESGIADSPGLFAEDIQRKAGGGADPEIVRTVAENASATLEWLADRHGFAFSVVDDFDYPGHRARRMHGLPSRSGAELMGCLTAAVETAGIPLLTEATVTSLYADPDLSVRGVAIARPDGSTERIGCKTLVLACSGYGGNPEMVRRHIPEMANAIYFGHPGNRGDALIWGEQLGAQARCLGSYQGHGSVADPHGVLITWAAMMEGGFQVDSTGRRFSDESRGYSEQAAVVLKDAGGVAFDIFDERIARIARQFVDFQEAEAIGAVVSAETLEGLARRMKLPATALTETFAEVDRLKAGRGVDQFGRRFAGRTLTPPYKAVRVTGALFHTQGGLDIDADARVRTSDGGVLPNLFAAGGAAAGVSGTTAAGYLSGNGLLTATVFGRKAGGTAARRVLLRRR